MKYWNSGKGEPNLLQKRFSGYLKTAVQRKKTDLFRTRNKVYGHEYFNDAWGNIPGVIVEDTYFNFPTQFDTTGLERAFQRIEPRDRYIFFCPCSGRADIYRVGRRTWHWLQGCCRRLLPDDP